MSTLLSDTDIEEAVSSAYAHAVAAAAGLVVSLRHFDRDGIDMTFETGGPQRPKLDAQLKATVNLSKNKDGVFRFPCPRKNYDHLRVPTQVPRILIVLQLPPEKGQWVECTAANLVLRNCAYWTCLQGAPETNNEASVTVDILPTKVFNPGSLAQLMEMSRLGKIE